MSRILRVSAALIVAVTLTSVLSSCFMPFLPRTGYLAEKYRDAPTPAPTSTTTWRAATEAEVPEVVTFDSGSTLPPSTGFAFRVALNDGWVGVDLSAADGVTIAFLPELGCTFELITQPLGAARVSDDDLKSTLLLIDSYLDVGPRFEAAQVQLVVTSPSSAVDALMVSSTAPNGGQVLTVARGFAAHNTGLISSLACDPGVDTAAVYASEIASHETLIAYVD